MRICIDCEFATSRAVQVGPNPNQIGMAIVCLNSECRDPVSGDPLPAVVARQQEVFCSFKAKYFQAKEVKPEAPVIQLVDK